MLQRVLQSYPSILIAFSGGADSSLLLAACARFMPGKQVLAALCTGPLTPPWEEERADALAKQLQVQLLRLDADELACAPIKDNGPLRCYYCKLHKMKLLKEVAAQHGIGIVADGSQLDDLREERPGNRALQELGIVSPLANAGLDKNAIIAQSRAWGLPLTPASACLATRFATGTPLNASALARVGMAESRLRPLLPGIMRLRCFFPHARLEAENHDKLKIGDILPLISPLGYSSLETAPYLPPAQAGFIAKTSL